MQIIESVAALRAALSGHTHTAFVPTMGNLHEGHLSLVRMARKNGEPVVASIFVNRLQFGPNEDFGRYPRTFERDCAALRTAGCDFVFAPDESELYPVPQTFRVATPTGLGNILEGAFRPGFFEGVATVVLKLFGCVQPALAVFGRKDYQQLLVIRAMARQFNLPVRILAGDIVREADGLAMSSRNGYLDAGERAEAPALYRTLQKLAQKIRTVAARPLPAEERSGRNGANSGSGKSRHDDLVQAELAALEHEGCKTLETRGWVPDYLSVRRREDLALPVAADLAQPSRLVVLGAARLGTTRLIDNLEF